MDESSGWVIDNIGAINIFISTYAKALMTVFLFAIVYRLWKTKRGDISFSLAILTTMGITLFHTLLWEVKPRYQFMTFALIILAAALSFDKIFRKKLSLDLKRAKQALEDSLSNYGFVVFRADANIDAKQPKQAIVVNAQQHSVNHFGYSKGSIDLGAGKSISQAFDLTTSANRIDFNSYANMEMKLILEKKS